MEMKAVVILHIFFLSLSYWLMMTKPPGHRSTLQNIQFDY